MKIFFKILAYTSLFIIIFCISAAYKSFKTLGIGMEDVYTLQGATGLTENVPFSKEIINVRYINKDRQVETRQIALYKPVNAPGDIALIYVPHYAVEEQAEDFKSYIRNGWAVASPYNFVSRYNGLLVTDGLVFNNAALYTLRNRSDINKQQIAIVGSSAGGYTALMLSQLQMGATASIANAPIANSYFNLQIHFLKCDSINRHSGMFEFPIPIQGMISKLFRPISENFKNEGDPLWEALSPLSMAKAFSNPTVINHNTGDILVPIDQITKRFSYDRNDGTLPRGFSGRMGNSYPGILSASLEEKVKPGGLSIHKYMFKNNKVSGTMPYSDKLLTINVIDDGPISGKSGHSAPGTAGSFNTIPFLQEMFAKTLKATEQPIPEKLLLLLERYQGNSKQLPPHSGVEDTTYGSLAVYRKEIIGQLSTYRDNHSLDELNKNIGTAISMCKDEITKMRLRETWKEIESKL